MSLTGRNSPHLSDIMAAFDIPDQGDLPLQFSPPEVATSPSALPPSEGLPSGDPERHPPASAPAAPGIVGNVPMNHPYQHEAAMDFDSKRLAEKYLVYSKEDWPSPSFADSPQESFQDVPYDASSPSALPFQETTHPYRRRNSRKAVPGEIRAVTAAKQKRNRERMQQLRRERAASLENIADKMKSRAYDPFKAFRCVMTDEHRELIACGLSDAEKLELLKDLQESLKAKQRHAMRMRRARLTAQQRQEQRRRNRERKQKTRHDPIIEFRRYMTDEQRKIFMQPDLDPETKNDIMKELTAVRKWVHREQTRKRRSRLTEEQKEDVRRRSREYKRRARSNPMQAFGGVMTERHYELLQQDLSEQQKEDLMQELIELKKAKQREEMRARRAKFSSEQKERERKYSRNYKRARREKTVADLISGNAGSTVPIPSGANIPMSTGNNIPMSPGNYIPMPHGTNVPIPSGTHTPMPSGTSMPMPTIAVKVKVKPMPGQHFAVQGIERSYAIEENLPLNISNAVSDDSPTSRYDTEKEKNRERQRKRRAMQTAEEREEERRKNRERSRMRRRRKAEAAGRVFHPRAPIQILPQENGAPDVGGYQSTSSQLIAQPSNNLIKNEAEQQYEQACENNNQSSSFEECQTPSAGNQARQPTLAGQNLNQTPVTQQNGQETPFAGGSGHHILSENYGGAQETLSPSSSDERMSKENPAEWFSEGMLDSVKKRNRSSSKRVRANMTEEQRERERERNRERQRIRRLLQSPEEREMYTVKQRMERRKRREDPAYRERERERQRERKRQMRGLPWYRERERSLFHMRKGKQEDQHLSASDVEAMIQQYIDGEEVPNQYPDEDTAVLGSVNVPMDVADIGEGQGSVFYQEPRHRRGRGRGRSLRVRVPAVEKRIQKRQRLHVDPAHGKTDINQEMYVQRQMQASNTVLSHLSHSEKIGHAAVVDAGANVQDCSGSNYGAGVKQEDTSTIFVGLNSSEDSEDVDEEQENKSMCDEEEIMGGACFRRDAVGSKDQEEPGAFFVNMDESGDWEDTNEDQSPKQDQDEENTGNVPSNLYGVHRIRPLN